MDTFLRGIHLVVVVVSIVLPQPVKRALLRKFLGWTIDPSASIGLSVVHARSVHLGEKARIGHANVIKNLQHLQLDNHARIGNLNWVFGVPSDSMFFRGVERDSSLHLGEHSAITSRHIIDATDAIRIGTFTTVAGYRSQLLSHSINIETGQQGCAPIVIGDRCFLGTSIVVFGGCRVHDRIVVGAGSIVNHDLKDVGSLYAGVPARKIKELDPASDYFSRSTGRVL